MTEEIEEIIKRKARELKDFCESGCSVGIHEAEKKLRTWYNNFSGITNQSELAGKLIDNIKFLRDSDVRDSCVNFLKSNSWWKSAMLCPLGGMNESSNRITRALNDLPQFRESLHEALEKSTSENICFIDDISNSGGQFQRIVGDWFSKQPTDSANSAKQLLSQDEITVLRRHRLIFVFYWGNEQIRLDNKKCLDSHELTGEIHIIKQELPENSIFGSDDDMVNIKNANDAIIENGIFANYRASELTELFQLCWTAGEQLTRAAEPNWQSDKVQNRILGFGNHPRLLITDNNIPTCTLTCLWRHGKVMSNGKEINWQPLFMRRKKQTQTAESGKTDTYPIVPQYVLDQRKHSSHPLEFVVWGSVDTSAITFETLNLESVSFEGMENYFDNSSLREFFETNNITVKKLNPSQYTYFNNHLAWCQKNGTPCRAKICEIQLISTPYVCLIAMRIKVYAYGVHLSQIASFLSKFLLCASAKKLPVFFCLPKNTIRDQVNYSTRTLLETIVEETIPAIKICKSNFRGLVFIRLASNDVDSPQLYDIIVALTSFCNPKNLQTNECHTSPYEFKLDYNCGVKVNNNGTVFVCGSDIPQNASGTFQTEIFKAYYLCEILHYVYSKLNIIFSPPGTGKFLNLSESLKLFFQRPPTSDKHLKEFITQLNRL